MSVDRDEFDGQTIMILGRGIFLLIDVKLLTKFVIYKFFDNFWYKNAKKCFLERICYYLV